MSIPALHPTERPVDLRLEALMRADSSRNMNKIFEAIQECALAPTLSFQEIETTLRNRGGFTYLIARKNENEEMSAEWPPGTKKTYMLWLSVRPPELAMKELLVESSSYAENFEKLRDTGVLHARRDRPVAHQLKGLCIKLTEAGMRAIAQEMAASRVV